MVIAQGLGCCLSDFELLLWMVIGDCEWWVIGQVLSCWSGSDWWLVLRFWIVIDQGLRVVDQVSSGDSPGFELLVKFWVVICQIWNSDWFYGSRWWLVRFFSGNWLWTQHWKTLETHNIFKQRWPFSSTPGDQGIKATEQAIIFYSGFHHCEKQGSYL